MTQRLRGRADAPDAPLLRALWLGLRGDWTSAHGIVQAEDGPDAEGEAIARALSAR